MPDSIKAAMDIALLTGLRQGDILALKRSNCRKEGLLVVTSKTGRKLLFEWTDELREATTRRMSGDVISMWIVHNKKGYPYSGEGFRTQWGKYIRNAIKDKKLDPEMRFAFKDLRIKAGSDSDDDNLLGHQNRAVLYRHYKRKAIKVRPSK